MAASRVSSPTERMASSVVRVMIGSINNASATAPASGEKRPVSSTTVEYANTPAMIDGSPVANFAQKRTIAALRPSGLTSARYTPDKIPIGIEMSAPNATTSNVPMIALPMPPPATPAAGGSCVIKAGPSFLAPFQINIRSTEKSGTAASKAKIPHATLKA